MPAANILENIPACLEAEVIEDLAKAESVRIERILSQGQASPGSGWYDQNENEWVIVIQGRGRLVFEDGPEVELGPGDYLNLPAHKKHKVAWTDPDAVTVWLAIFYK